ncbi:MAG TPA: MBL fold metallo-hydrolase [Dehalococcoidales bacterium]|nr:MBL fold metallo-hydrolase [Dehalococcoidales bacterium]
MKQITPNVYVETGNRGCNTGFVVTSDGVLAHDTPMVREVALKWVEEIAKHGELCYVVNGEGHGDHIGGNCYMGGIHVGSEGTRELILKATVEEYKTMIARLAPGFTPNPDFHHRAPDITFTDKLTIYLGKHTFRLLAMPGHTPYNVVTYVPEEGVIFTSDNVVTGMPFFFQSVPDEWVQSLKYLQTLNFDKIVCGHGEVQEKSYLQKMIQIVQGFVAPVADAVKKGMTLEETKKTVTYQKEFPELIKMAPNPAAVGMSVTRIYDYLKNKKK